MRKVIHVSIIMLIVIGICLSEQLLSNHYLTELNKKVNQIDAILYVTEDISTNKIPHLTDDLYTYWTGKEKVICTFINHKEIEDIGVEINKMKTALTINDKNKYQESLNLVKYYIKSYQHIIGVNLQNIF